MLAHRIYSVLKFNIKKRISAKPLQVCSTIKSVLNNGIEELFQELLRSEQKRYAFEDLESEMIKREEQQNRHYESWLGILRVFPGMNRRNGNKPLLNFVSSHTIIDLGGDLKKSNSQL